MFPADQGAAFGTWPDPTSRLLYADVMPVMLNGLDTGGLSVVDLGGGNGLLKQWIPQAVTVDVDQEKHPDVLADLLTWEGLADLIVLRYVLHYLDDSQVTGLFAEMALWHPGQVLVIQFVNDDIPAKEANSVGETAWFRSESDLMALISPAWEVQSRKRVEYQVTREFYANRLGNPNGTAHEEAVIGLLLDNTTA